MVIARATGGATFEVVDREREVVQIGRGSFASGRLQAAAMQRTAEALAGGRAFAPVRVIGASGSIHAVAELAHRDETGQAIPQLNGHVLGLDALEQVTRKLQKLSLAEREKLPGLDAKRAEIIVPGAMVLAHVLEAFDAEALVLSDFGVREGLVTDYLARHRLEIQALGPVEDVKLRSVLQLLQKFQPEEGQHKHARHVTNLALSLYDGLKSRHTLPDESRT